MIYALKKKKKKNKKWTQPDPKMIDVSCNPYSVLLSSFNGFFCVGGGLWGREGGREERGGGYYLLVAVFCSQAPFTVLACVR